MLAPCDAPKLLPAIVTDVPTTPEAGFRLVMLGAGLPPLAGRKAAMAAAQMSELFSVPFADTGPAAATIRSSAASFVFGAPAPAPDDVPARGKAGIRRRPQADHQGPLAVA